MKWDLVIPNTPTPFPGPTSEMHAELVIPNSTTPVPGATSGMDMGDVIRNERPVWLSVAEEIAFLAKQGLPER